PGPRRDPRGSDDAEDPLHSHEHGENTIRAPADVAPVSGVQVRSERRRRAWVGNQFGHVVGSAVARTSPSSNSAHPYTGVSTGLPERGVPLPITRSAIAAAPALSP